MSNYKAIISTSGNPFHYGHLSLYKTGERIFGKDKVLVLIAKNPYKNSVDIEQIKFHLVPYQINYQIMESGTIADYCKDNNIDFIIRGIRNAVDTEYELKLDFINKEINKQAQTLFIPTDDIYSNISSSTIRDLVAFDKYDIANKYMDQDALYRFYNKQKYTIYFGQCCVGKSTYLKNNNIECIDFDNFVWEVLTTLHGVEKTEQIKIKSKDIFDNYNVYAAKQYASELLDKQFWDYFFVVCSCNIDWASLGFYYEFIPIQHRSRCKFIRIHTTISNRFKRIQLKGFEDKIEKLDNLYQDTPFFDDQILI